MSQEKIMALLKENKKKWFSSDALIKTLKITRNVVNRNLRVLRRFNFIEYKQGGYHYHQFFYRWKND
jgi:biotin operon repressor